MTNVVLKNGGAAYVPPDLLNDTSTPDLNSDYFDVVVTDLALDTDYAMQFAWVYEDKTLSPYSASYDIHTLAEPAPNAPQFITGDLYGGEGFLKVTWSGKDYLGNDLNNIDRVEVFIEDTAGTFAHGLKSAASFKKASTITIVCPAGEYTVWLKAVTAKGTYSEASNSLTVNATSIGFTVEQPTLPVGLTVATAPFGITVNWGGAYASDDPFYGFKTIAIYATTASSLGTSTTTAFSETSLVGNLSVTQTVNRINIGIDNLKQALSLSSSEDVYNADIYLYYIAYNVNNEPYKVSGNPTYTRINSTPISPTKANLIDLEDGLISIENLVAGNGQFTSWLRTGTAGGARIELNGGAGFTNNGNVVLPGLTVYSSGDTPIFRASLDGVVSFGGYSPSDIALISSTASDASASAASKATVFRQMTTPTSLAAGDVWINTADTTAGRNTIYIAAIAGADTISAGEWIVSKDLDINDVLLKAGAFDTNGNINRAIQIPVPNGVAAGSIASVKTGYADGATGWYIGWNGVSSSSVPVVDIGSSTNYFRWDGDSVLIRGKLETVGSPGGYASNVLTIDGGKISADEVIYLDSSGWIDMTATDGININGNVEITGTTQLSGTTYFNGSAQVTYATEVGTGSTKWLRNIYINSTLIGLTSSTGEVGDIWIQYA